MYEAQAIGASRLSGALGEQLLPAEGGGAGEQQPAHTGRRQPCERENDVEHNGDDPSITVGGGIR